MSTNEVAEALALQYAKYCDGRNENPSKVSEKNIMFITCLCNYGFINESQYRQLINVNRDLKGGYYGV